MSSENASFPIVRWREGYDISEVDEFIDWIDQELTDVAPQPDVAQRIRETRFTPRAFKRSYGMEAVDDFLDLQVQRAEAGSR